MRLIWALAVAVLLLDQCWGQGPTTVERLDQAQIALFEGLQAEDPDMATDWSQRLDRSNLLELLRQGPLADPQELEAILQLYRKDRPGLDREPFVKVRGALAAHIDALRATREKVQRLLGELPEFESFDQSAWLTRQQAQLDDAIAKVDRYLNNSGERNAALWKKFFDWEGLLASVQGLREATRLNAAAGRHYMRLQEVHENFFGYTEGLGSPPFLALRNEIGEYLEVYILTKSPPQSIPPEVDRRLQQLRRAVTSYEYDHDPSARAKIGDLLAWLDRARQAEELVDRLRERYGRPNVKVKVAEAFAGAGINDAINDVSPVCERLLGTNIRGTANTTGRFYLDLAPSAAGLSLNVRVEACARSRTVGVRGRVRVHSVGNTGIQAGKPLFFSEDGQLSSAARGWARCDTATRITGVSHHSRLVRRIAYNKALQYKGVGERYANDKGELEAVEQLEQQTRPLIAQANEAFRSKVRQPLTGLEVYPRNLRLQSTMDQIRGIFSVRTDSQLAANSEPPALPPQSFAAAVQVHESALTNVADNLIRGFTLNEENTVELLEKLKRDVPAELKSGEQWSMKFADRNSVVVRFNDNLIQLGFRGEEFTQGGGQPIQTEIEFLANYRAEIEPRGLVLRRVGKVEGNVIAERARLDDVAVMSVIVKKFNAVFTSEIVVKPRKLPEPYDKAGDILPKFFQCGHGWASAAIDAANLR